MLAAASDRKAYQASCMCTGGQQYTEGQQYYLTRFGEVTQLSQLKVIQTGQLRKATGEAAGEDGISALTGSERLTNARSSTAIPSVAELWAAGLWGRGHLLGLLGHAAASVGHPQLPKSPETPRRQEIP